MSEQFPGAVPEMPVDDVARAAVKELADRGGRSDDTTEREDARARS